MSKEIENAPAPEPAPPERIRRGRIGMNVAVQVVLGVVLFLMVNVLAHRRFKQWDYTYSRSYTLADTTVKFIGQVKEPVRVTVLVGRKEAKELDARLEEDAGPLLEQYGRHMSGRLEVEYIDTTRDVNLWENFMLRLDQRKSGLRPATDGILVQAELPHKSDGGQEVYFHKWIPAESLYALDQQKKVPVAFRGESLLNAALAAVTNPERPRVAVVTNMGNLKVRPEGTIGHVLADICSAQNIDLEGWRMMESPGDAHLYRSLILAGVTVFGDQEDADLTQFYETPGNSVLVLLDPQNGCEGMDKWLARYGIQAQADRVLFARSTANGPYKELSVDATFLEGSLITRGLESRATLLPGQTRSLKLDPAAQKVKAENIQLTPLLTPGADFWGEKKFMEAMPLIDPEDNTAKPLCVAATVERGAATDPRLQMQSSRLVVVGNADLALPPPSPPNYDFLTRSLNWMLHRDDATANDSSTDKAKHKFTLRITKSQRQRIFLITTVVLPLAAMMAGLVIWSTRRT